MANNKMNRAIKDKHPKTEDLVSIKDKHPKKEDLVSIKNKTPKLGRGVSAGSIGAANAGKKALTSKAKKNKKK